MWKANFVQLFATTFYLYDLLKVALKHVKKQLDSKNNSMVHEYASLKDNDNQSGI